MRSFCLLRESKIFDPLDPSTPAYGSDPEADGIALHETLFHSRSPGIPQARVGNDRRLAGLKPKSGGFQRPLSNTPSPCFRRSLT
jgi:hypothetical protein